MPDLPTVAEAGLTGFDAGSWLALAAPRATPASVVGFLAEFCAGAMNDPRLRPAQDRQAVVPDTLAPEPTLALWRREYAAWGEVIRAARITAE
jgi:tripartite-type tricarboxylate transporter receptor subunit TctC